MVLLAFNFINRRNLNTDISKLEKSIAVLPFRNDSPSDSTTYFINGIMDEILNNLQKIGAFSKVLSRNSVELYRSNTSKSTPTIAKELGVNYIVEGSGQKYGNSYRIRVELIAGKTDKHLWADSYEREIRVTKDIYGTQSEIAQSVASALKATITPEEKQRIEKVPTKNLEANNLYTLGRFYINQNTEEKLKEGIKCFKDAIKLDSTFALAYVGLSQCYQFMVRYSWMSREDGYSEAKKAVIKAIKLDESLGEAHATLGLIMIVFDWDIYGPEQEFQKAIKLSPNSSEVYSSYAQYLRWVGRYDQGVSIAKRAIELDPLTPITNMWLGINYFYAGYYDKSIDQLKKIVTLDPNYLYAYSHLAFNFALKGLYSEAIHYADKTMSLIGNISNDPFNASYAGWVYAKSGESTKAKEILTQVKELYGQTNGDPIHIALIYSGLGEYQKALEYILGAYKIRSGQMIYLNAFSDSFFKDIKSDPRFKDILIKTGFKVN